jgi:hypothetical protein
MLDYSKLVHRAKTSTRHEGLHKQEHNSRELGWHSGTKCFTFHLATFFGELQLNCAKHRLNFLRRVKLGNLSINEVVVSINLHCPDLAILVSIACSNTDKTEIRYQKTNWWVYTRYQLSQNFFYYKLGSYKPYRTSLLAYIRYQE